MSERESNEKDGRYGQLWYAVPSVFAGWQEHRLLHLDQGTRAVLGARNAPLQEFCLGLGFSLLLTNCNAQK